MCVRLKGLSLGLSFGRLLGLFDLPVLCCVNPMGSFTINSSDSKQDLTSARSRGREKNGTRALLLPNCLTLTYGRFTSDALCLICDIIVDKLRLFAGCEIQ